MFSNIPGLLRFVLGSAWDISQICFGHSLEMYRTSPGRFSKHAMKDFGSVSEVSGIFRLSRKLKGSMRLEAGDLFDMISIFKTVAFSTVLFLLQNCAHNEHDTTAFTNQQ